MGSGISHPDDTTTTTQSPVMNNQDAVSQVTQEEWHVFEFHVPTMISGGAGIVALGIFACCLNRAYKRWLMRVYRRNQKEQVRLAKRMAANRPALNHLPDAPPHPGDDAESQLSYAYRFK